MTYRYLFGALVLVIPTAAGAGAGCARPDASFASFLATFKNNQSFRESRLVLPLKASWRDPAGTTTESLTLAQIRAQKLQIIRGDKRTRELRGGEGQLCESVPKVGKTRAEFGQYACGTDVYRSAYYFVRIAGCWRLTRFTDAGG